MEVCCVVALLEDAVSLVIAGDIIVRTIAMASPAVYHRTALRMVLLMSVC